MTGILARTGGEPYTLITFPAFIIRMKKLLIIACFLGLLSSAVRAQNILPVRLEVPSAMDVETFHVEPLSTDGVLIFYESNEVNELELRKWYFGLFNTKMKQEWLKYVALPDKIEFITSSRSGDNLYLLFKSFEKVRGDNGYYEIVRYNIRNQEFSKVSGTIPEKSAYVGFQVIGNVGCLALNLDKDETDLLFINLTSGDINPVSVRSQVKSRFLSVYADQQNERFYVVVKSLKDNKYLSDEIMRYSVDGREEQVLMVASLESIKSTREFIFLQPENNLLRILGTYDILTGRVNSLSDLDNDDIAKGAGMFYLSFENGRQKVLNFYDFLSFDNVYGTLGNRQMEYSRSKNAEDGSSGKSLTAYYHMYDPRIIRVNDQYVFSVEVYKPYYRSETRMDYDFYGRPVPYTYQIFDGYNFYDVILAGISDEGNLIWNNDFVIRDLRTFTLDRNSIVFPDGDFVSMAYINEGKIISQTIEGPVDIGYTETVIETKFDRDRIAGDENNNIVHWYDDYFLVYGYQKVNNRSLGDQGIRTVFYANKVAFQ